MLILQIVNFKTQPYLRLLPQTSDLRKKPRKRLRHQLPVTCKRKKRKRKKTRKNGWMISGWFIFSFFLISFIIDTLLTWDVFRFTVVLSVSYGIDWTKINKSKMHEPGYDLIKKESSMWHRPITMKRLVYLKNQVFNLSLWWEVMVRCVPEKTWEYYLDFTFSVF